MALVYITVFESLQHIGRLEAGQVSSVTKVIPDHSQSATTLTLCKTVLIHSGAGGLGFAAIQVAQMIGAEVRVIQ
jgi:NADPH:quinone reductase-like Zn-dependent oxidoreductase